MSTREEVEGDLNNRTLAEYVTEYIFEERDRRSVNAEWSRVEEDLVSVITHAIDAYEGGAR